MALNKIITCAIYTSFVLFGIIQTADSDEITINQLVGPWFGIGKISPTSDPYDHMACCRMQVSRPSRRYQNFFQVTTCTLNGYVKKFEGNGEIVDSQIHSSYPFFSNNSIFTAQVYKNGQDVILTDQTTSALYGLICRNLQCSAEAISAFENLAQQHSASVKYFRQNSCKFKTSAIPHLG